MTFKRTTKYWYVFGRGVGPVYIVETHGCQVCRVRGPDADRVAQQRVERHNQQVNKQLKKQNPRRK